VQSKGESSRRQRRAARLTVNFSIKAAKQRRQISARLMREVFDHCVYIAVSQWPRISERAGWRWAVHLGRGHPRISWRNCCISIL